MIGNERNKISVCNSHAGRLLTGLGQLGAGSGQNFFVSHFPYFIHSKKKKQHCKSSNVYCAEEIETNTGIFEAHKIWTE